VRSDAERAATGKATRHYRSADRDHFAEVIE
jgi:hypothetical protein